MSVIAKLMLRNVVNYGTGSYAELGCLCDNDLMAAYAVDEQDKLFTKYSPWGEMRISQHQGWSVFYKTEEHIADPTPTSFYVMLLTEDEAGEATFPGASAFLKVDCYSKTKFAGDGSRVELREAYRGESPDISGRRRDGVVQKLSWKMQVDNPPAEDAFVPGTKYWLAFYDAAKFDRNAAIRAAHGHPAAS